MRPSVRFEYRNWKGNLISLRVFSCPDPAAIRAFLEELLGTEVTLA